jgi:hypothetical protein
MSEQIPPETRPAANGDAPGQPAAPSAAPAVATSVGYADEFWRLRSWLALVVVLQVAVLIGIVVVYLQFAGLPGQVASRVPYSGDNGGQIYQLQADLNDLRSKVVDLTTRIMVIQHDVEASPVPGPGG